MLLAEPIYDIRQSGKKPERNTTTTTRANWKATTTKLRGTKRNETKQAEIERQTEHRVDRAHGVGVVRLLPNVDSTRIVKKDKAKNWRKYQQLKKEKNK